MPPPTPDGPLAGVRVVTIAVNLPGPLAAARFAALGAHVVKVEPPTGDPLQAYTATAYDELNTGQEVVVLDLKTEEGRSSLRAQLALADVFVTSHRPAALARLGLDWESVHEAHPRLIQVAIVGHPTPDADVPGHDLTYQAVNGILDGERLPRVLVGDLGGGERAVIEGLAALYARGSDGPGVYCEVALSMAAQDFSRPFRWGMTAPEGLLGGAFPAYGVYPSRDGLVAVAALEPHFLTRLLEALGVEHDADALREAFATRTGAEWEAFAAEYDVPLTVVAIQG